jgi:hypothetical protein
MQYATVDARSFVRLQQGMIMGGGGVVTVLPIRSAGASDR